MKKALSPEEASALIGTLKTRFEKTGIATKILNGLRYKQNWKPILKNFGHCMQWKKPAANRMWWLMIEKPTNTFFMIAQRKARKDAEAFVMTMRRWRQGKNTNRKIVQFSWQLR